MNKTTKLTLEELEEKYKNLGNFNNSSINDNFVFPIARKIAAHTLATGGWVKSKKQQLKEDRINKLRQLQGKEPNVILPDDEYVDGLVPVKPMSAPKYPEGFYMDYKYED